MQITRHKAVSINYTLTNDKGETLDSSEGGDPLAYIHGVGALISGLETALEGKATGDSLKVSLKPEDAYGMRDDSMVRVVPKEAFGDEVELEVGMVFQSSGGEGPKMIVITEIDGENVTVDGNHPLAGEALNFDVKVVGVRDATTEELEHGHIHGPGGHEH
jgi:FKBP-type peptidyl-prolyl cis-trans isomerase SlyD